MSADRTPEQIIGHDRLMQLVFEGYAVVRADRIASLEAAMAKREVDAERWRALMSSQRMHFMGCAGIELVNKPGTTSRKTADLIPVMKPGEYQHFGMEFWSEHKAFGNPEYPDDFERALLIAYADHLRAGALSSSKQKDGE
jgi:hypothetical protein